MPEPRWMLLLAGLGVSLGTLAEGRDMTLRTNPFLKPAFLAAVETRGSQADAADTVTLELRAIMLAGQQSQANIGGKIIGLGEEINGYRLLEVHARHVVLERDGTHKQISIDDRDAARRD